MQARMHIGYSLHLCRYKDNISSEWIVLIGDDDQSPAAQSSARQKGSAASDRPDEARGGSRATGFS